jgi:hypothetical protein
MMPDPVEEQLNALRQTAHFPIPDPVAVRKRGDRLRRRAAALKVGGTATALALSLSIVLTLAGRPDSGPPTPADQALTVSDTLSVADLPAPPRAEAWRVLRDPRSPLACLPAHTLHGLGASQEISRSYGAFHQGSPSSGFAPAQVHETVLAFRDAAGANAALGIVTERLRSHCAARDLGNRDPLESQVLTGRGTGIWELYVRKADQVCTECDAAYFDRQAAVRVADRLVLLSFGELGGPAEPKGLAASMRRLVGSAVARAGAGGAGGGD